MDHFFDQAARLLASPVPRRQALKLWGSSLLAGLFGAAAARPAQAQGGSHKVANGGSTSTVGDFTVCSSIG